ncbi:hypothetical protein GQ457_15G029600 [Hibiscus cannabinus]
MKRGIVGEEPLRVDSDQSVWTLFVHNIADRLHWKGVWKVFDRHGVVVDVFIPHRRSRAGRWFGFVRMASKEDADRVIERLNGFWQLGVQIRCLRRIEGLGQRPLGAGWITRRGRENQIPSWNGTVGGFEEGRVHRFFDDANIRGGILVDVYKEEDMRDLISRPAIKQWFTKIEGWKPGVQIGSRSVWLSVVGIPIHLWSEDTFCNIAQVWGSLIRVEDATAEPQSFERARFLIETSCVDRIEETLKLFWGEESYRIRIQEVEVVHSHDLMCNCADSDTVVSSEDKQGAVDKLQLVRDNPTFASVNCDEWLGLVDRNIEVISDHVDVMWEAQPELEPPEWTSVKIRGETVFSKMEQLRGETFTENQEQLLALEWVTQSEKPESSKELLFNTKWRALVWVKASKEGLFEILDEWWQNPSNCLIGSVKFNVEAGVQWMGRPLAISQGIVVVEVVVGLSIVVEHVVLIMEEAMVMAREVGAYGMENRAN